MLQQEGELTDEILTALIDGLTELLADLRASKEVHDDEPARIFRRKGRQAQSCLVPGGRVH